jgi:hypothetical protein
MKKILIAFVFIQFITSCGPQTFLTNKGLNFTNSDWRNFYEQPYVVNTLDGKDLYLPVALFGESELLMAYFEDLQSDDISYTDDQKSQIVVRFKNSIHKKKKPVYELFKDHAVVRIKSGSSFKALKLKDIRLPNS